MSTGTNIEHIFHTHSGAVAYGFSSINLDLMQKAADVIVGAIIDGKNIFTCGNGASASIAQHWACDYTKGCSFLERGIKPRVISLSGNIPLMTAISNDISYDEVYSYQLERLADPGDVLITISSSGNSPNVVRAIEVAKTMDVTTIALTGFHGGKCKEMSDIPVHVDLHEYEAAEDVHQAIMHMIAKYIRMKTNA